MTSCPCWLCTMTGASDSTSPSTAATPPSPPAGSPTPDSSASPWNEEAQARALRTLILWERLRLPVVLLVALVAASLWAFALVHLFTP